MAEPTLSELMDQKFGLVEQRRAMARNVLNMLLPVGQVTEDNQLQMPDMQETALGAIFAGSVGKKVRRLKAAAIKMPDGQIFTGKSHMSIEPPLGAIIPTNRGRLPIRGFIDSDGKFVSGNDAASIALNANQIRDNATLRGVTADLKAGRNTAVPSESVIGIEGNITKLKRPNRKVKTAAEFRHPRGRHPIK